MNQELENPSKVVQEVMLPVQQLASNRWNRKTFDAQGIGELADSIKSKGILEPLVVRKLEEGKYEIASGERRWRAALQAGLTEVPCRILDLTEDDVQDMNLIANIQREDIPALEKAAMVKARMDSNNLSQSQIAARLGKGQDWVSDLLKVLTLPKEIQKNLASFSLGVRPMQAVASLPNADYKSQIVKELQEGKIKPEHVEHRAHQLHNGFKASVAKRAKKNRTADDAITAEASPKPSSTAAAGAQPLQRWRASAEGSVADEGSIKPINGHDGFPPTTRGNDGKDAASSAGLPSLITGLKDDLADAYLPSFGRVGGALRTGLDTAWQKVNGKGQMGNGNSLLKWGLMFTVVSFLWHPVLKTINYVFTRLMHIEVNQAISRESNVPGPRSDRPSTLDPRQEAGAPTPQKLNLSDLSSVPAPTGLHGELKNGQKILFTWNPVPHCFYNFYSRQSWNPNFTKENTQPLQHATALWTNDSGRPEEFHFVVTAVNAQDQESVYSPEMVIDLRPKP